MDFNLLMFAKKLKKFIVQVYFLGSVFIGLAGCAGVAARSQNELKISSHKDIILGEKFSFYSNSLKETRSYWVHLPKSYYDGTIQPKKYPVLYILDGEAHFNYASGLADFMGADLEVLHNYQIPELIVVAIPNKDPGKDNRFRDYSPTLVSDFYSESGGGDLYLKFLHDELIPRVESEYRTIPLRVLAGHSMGGLLATYDLLNTPSVFNAYIAMDPSLWWDNKMVFSKAQKLPNGLIRSPLYLSTYGKAKRKEEWREFVVMLAKKNPLPFRSEFQVFESEGHGSLPLVSLYNGLLFIFEGFEPNLNSFVEDPSSIEKHFSKFSHMLGVDILPPEDLIHLVCNETVKDYPDKAIDCFQVNVSNYPMSYNAHNALAKVYANKGMKDKATTSYRKSLEIKPDNIEGIQGLKELERK